MAPNRMPFTWDDSINLGGSSQIDKADAKRQKETAQHLVEQLNNQPGVILADEVGLGKTFVALAVAASVAASTQRRNPIIVLVPPALTQKWPQEWKTFAEYCLPSNSKLRATEHTIKRPAEFLRLFDDDATTRNHIAFVSHGALTRQLADPFTKLAIIRSAYYRSHKLGASREKFPLWANSLINTDLPKKQFAPELIEVLLGNHLDRWQELLDHHLPESPFTDDPVYLRLPQMIKASGVDLGPLKSILADLPVRNSAAINRRLKAARIELNSAIQEIWGSILTHAPINSPLLIMDEAHHARHVGKISGLFHAPDNHGNLAETLDAGALAGKFDHMLFMTATPFQLGHRELISVLSRFDGVRWPSVAARKEFATTLHTLASSLDEFQLSAARTQKQWSQLTQSDVASLPEEWWQPGTAQTELVAGSSNVLNLRASIRELEIQVRRTQKLLKPWVVRHVRNDRSERRATYPGDSIRTNGDPTVGLVVDSESLFPFLLAARARSLATDKRLGANSSRAFFAEGISSSFEAYKDTRRNRESSGAKVPSNEPEGTDTRLNWYLDWVERTMPSHQPHAVSQHPKVRATVERVMEVWRRGEKALVFCFYVETGRTLRREISAAMERDLFARTAELLGIPATSTQEISTRIQNTSDNIYSSDSAPRIQLEEELRSNATDAGLNSEESIAFAEAVIGFLRTPSFIVGQVFPHGTGTAALSKALIEPDIHGRTYIDRLKEFANRLAQLSDAQRANSLKALGHIKTGRIRTRDEVDGEIQTTMVLPNVRLANGDVDGDDRDILVSAFNMPFFPDVLVSSSVLSEGVDLHWECRTVIHHDLDWNPSNLEQRTGRLDRIGSLAQALDKPIDIYEPYTQGMQDEKTYKVVMDRAQWFNIVMGDAVDLNDKTIDGISERVPMPDKLKELLSLDLSVSSQFRH